MIIEETESGYKIEFPKSFDDYNILNYERKGCFSVVFKIIKKDTNKIFAAKVISKVDMQKQNCLEDIYAEITIHNQLIHPNIVKLIRSLEITNSKNDEFIVLIEEYCEKGDLASYFNEFGFQNEIEMKTVEIGIIESVKYLHQLGYAHSDIKPENILLDDNMIPKLCDFGCCEFCGNNINHNFFKSDIWSIGQILYTFSEKKKLGLNRKVETSDKKLKILVEKCISLDLSKRPNIFDLQEDEYFIINNNEEESDLPDDDENEGINFNFLEENVD